MRKIVSPAHSAFVVKTACALAGGLLLAGCMPPQVSPNPPVTGADTAMDRELMQSVRQIQQVTDNLRAAHSVAWHGVYQGFPMRDGVSTNPDSPPVPSAPKPSKVSGPLGERMTVQWSGPVDVLGKALARKLGWVFEDRSGMGTQFDVSVYGQHETVLSILRQMSDQLPDSVVVRVAPGKIVIANNRG